MLLWRSRLRRPAQIAEPGLDLPLAGGRAGWAGWAGWRWVTALVALLTAGGRRASGRDGVLGRLTFDDRTLRTRRHPDRALVGGRAGQGANWGVPEWAAPATPGCVGSCGGN